jgi:hypothetical protein
MMKLFGMNVVDEKIGLCQSCRYARVINTNRGSTFYLCRLAERDPRFPKYPRLPVLACAGYEADADPEFLSDEPRSEQMPSEASPQTDK